MSWKLITRGAPRRVRKDFICPTHGKFTALVDSGTEFAPCPIPRDASPMVTAREAYARLDRGDYSGVAPCGLASPWSPSVIPMRMRRAQATTGKSETPEHRDWDFTRNLEEGQDPDEWQADRDAKAERDREQFVFDAVRED
jgi:hypothetical protein